MNSEAIYEIVFIAATSGTIKKIDITFPVGTDISIAGFMEIVGIGPSTASRTGNSLSLNVLNQVMVSAGTVIKLEIGDIANPSTSTNYKIIATTRNPTDATINGPTLSTAYRIRQIENDDIANDAITTKKVTSSFAYKRVLADGESGWNPDGIQINFAIIDPLFDVAEAVIVVNLVCDSTAPIATCAVSNLAFEAFSVKCTRPPPNLV